MLSSCAHGELTSVDVVPVSLTFAAVIGREDHQTPFFPILGVDSDRLGLPSKPLDGDTRVDCILVNCGATSFGASQICTESNEITSIDPQ